MPHKDKEQRNAYSKAYYKTNKSKINGRMASINRRRRQDRYSKVRALKENPCVVCGHKYPYFVMDFDHRDPGTKVADVSTLVKRCFAWTTVLSEIAKCDLVCACCHRLRTYKGESTYRTRRFVHHRAVLNTLKATTPCVDCGCLFKPCQMDFDHVGHEPKADNVARLVDGPSEVLLAELAKCHLVCANCHRVRGHTGIRPPALKHSMELVFTARGLLESTPTPKDKRFKPFPYPCLLGKLSDKVLAQKSGMSKDMVAWHRRRAGILLNSKGERIQP